VKSRWLARARWADVALFLVITFTLSWTGALLTRGMLDAAAAPMAVRLFMASLVYVIWMGWQPLLGLWIVRRTGLDDEHRPSLFRPFDPKYAAVAILGSAGLAMTAMFVSLAADWLLSTSNGPRAVSLADASASDFEFGGPMMVAIWTAVLLMWVQTVTEEVGWRGYFLARSMQLFGPWAGLSLHGAVWGLWYATTLLVGQARTTASLTASIGFLVTCSLLGILLGWLRLAARSLAPAVTANCLLTAIAGLPLWLQGQDLGFRSAAYGPAGWLPMGICILVLAATPLRELVRPLATSGVPSRSAVPHGLNGDRTLH
jgi:uncharacterized protein